MTRVQTLRVDPAGSPDEVVCRAVSILRDGGLVVAPTETRYGLLARADRTDVLNRLLETKRRAPDRAISVFVPTVADIDSYAVMTPIATKLAASFLPGPLTLVLEATGPEQPPLVVNGKIGIRVSSATIVNLIVTRLGLPVSATSANLSGEGGADSINGIIDSLAEEIDLCIDCGPLKGEPSTVVDASGVVPQILRSGSITETEILAVVTGSAI